MAAKEEPKRQLIIDGDTDPETVLKAFEGVSLAEVEVVQGGDSPRQALLAWLTDATGTIPPPLVHIGSKKKNIPPEK